MDRRILQGLLGDVPVKFEYRHLERPYDFPAPYGEQDYALLLFVADEAVTSEEERALCRQIVRQGCRNAVCAGHTCESWHDTIDMACLERDSFEVKDETFVMTSWHTQDSLEDVVFTFLRCTAFDDWKPERFLVTVVGGDGHHVDEIRAEIEKQTGAK